MGKIEVTMVASGGNARDEVEADDWRVTSEGVLILTDTAHQVAAYANGLWLKVQRKQ